ncbi:MAG: hypothetical protein A3G24_22890 [Betaproteobacteria bacterium RIFCSPLOWO2_12_FULL_62_13]|nr:MAG: hypothetical protein A3G24_22890 [Betaproteobacteria bacterium RIFCSPLOWO2_12_FULL_62_13]
MSLPRKRRNFWDDSEATPEDTKRGTANRARVLKGLIRHALSAEPLDAARVAQWHKDGFSGLSYVELTDECLLGAYRGTDHPRLKNMYVRVGGIDGAPPREVNEELQRFFGQLQKRVGDLGTRIKLDQDKSREEVRQIAEVAGWAHGEWVRGHWGQGFTL